MGSTPNPPSRFASSRGDSIGYRQLKYTLGEGERRSYHGARCNPHFPDPERPNGRLGLENTPPQPTGPTPSVGAFLHPIPIARHNLITR